MTCSRLRSATRTSDSFTRREIDAVECDGRLRVARLDIARTVEDEARLAVRHRDGDRQILFQHEAIVSRHAVLDRDRRRGTSG